MGLNCYFYDILALTFNHMTLNRLAILSLILLACTIAILFCADQIIKTLSGSFGREPIGLLDLELKYIVGIAVTVPLIFIAGQLSKNNA